MEDCSADERLKEKLERMLCAGVILDRPSRTIEI